MKNFLFLILFLKGFIFTATAQLSGCPDPAAINYDSTATINDGSCLYNNAIINPKTKYNLNSLLNESSGLIWWKNLFWTHDDSGGQPVIYAMNSSVSTIQRTVTVTNATNVDWEDIAQDKSFIYVGDFGNNANGNRTDLKIYKIAKADINAGNSVTAQVINFSYSDQTDFSAKGSNNTNFDCEALIAYGDSLYLFSKDWLDFKTRLYSLPKKAGTYSATKLSELDIHGLITGADVLSNEKVIVLSGYNSLLSPFIYLLYDFTGNHFFDANKRKVSLNEGFTQTEGICAKTTTSFFITNERYSKLGITTPAKLQQLNVSSFLNPYYSTLDSTKASKNIFNSKIHTKENKWAYITTNSNFLQVHTTSLSDKNASIQIYDAKGIAVLKRNMTSSLTSIDISELSQGIYHAKIYSGKKQISLKFIK